VGLKFRITGFGGIFALRKDRFVEGEIPNGKNDDKTTPY